VQGKWPISLKNLADDMIKYTSCKQIPIEEFILPFSGTLSNENRWVIMANLLPWDEMASVYISTMSKDMGREAVNPRVAVGALIIKHTLRATDEDTIEFIKENPYLQYFLGCIEYRYVQPFTPSLFVSIRKRLGLQEFDQLTEEFMSHVHQIEREMASKKKKSRVEKDPSPPSGPTSEAPNEVKPEDPETGLKNNGHLIVDATVAPSDIKYPTDLDLLNDSREKSEQLIDLLYVSEKGKIKPRTYRKNARKEYLTATKQRKKRTNKIRKAIRTQLNYLGRNLRTLNALLDEKGTHSFPLAHKHQKMYWIIQELYRQQKQMYDTKMQKIADRIVSISQPHVRPIVRGKAGKKVEFGAKISVSLVDGYSYLDRVSWDAYNEGTDLITQIESYRKRFGYYPEWVSADNIYGTRENRAFMKKHKIHYSGVALGRRPKELTQEQKELASARKKKAKQRSQIEGIFGVGKRKYDLDLVKAKTKVTSESWIGMVYLVMNIAHFMRVIFWSFLKKSYSWFDDQQITTFNVLVPPEHELSKHALLTF